MVSGRRLGFCLRSRQRRVCDVRPLEGQPRGSVEENGPETCRRDLNLGTDRELSASEDAMFKRGVSANTGSIMSDHNVLPCS